MAKYLLFFCALLSLAAFPAEAKQKRFELVTMSGVGEASIEGGDYIAARQRARDRAMEQALWKAIAALSSQEQADKSKEALNAAIVSKGMTFVHSYRFSEETINQETHTYRVAMEFSFFTDHITKHLEKGGLKVAEKPKAVVIVDERAMGLLGDSGLLITPSATEELFKETLGDAGFKAFGRAKVRSLKNDAESLKAVGGDAAALKWLAAQCGAEFVVIGSTRAKQAEKTMDTEGTVSVNIYDAKTGASVWAKEVVEKVPGQTGADKFRAVRAGVEKMDALLIEFLAARKAAPAPAAPPAPAQTPPQSAPPAEKGTN
ncbi:MAG: hypothetical protein HZA04_04280 [Nitrospinae bacterium]|nr:hypothetical protein [Nitrospinota bacterium]